MNELSITPLTDMMIIFIDFGPSSYRDSIRKSFRLSSAMMLNSPSFPHTLQGNDSMEMIQEEDEGRSSLTSSGIYPPSLRGSNNGTTLSSSISSEERGSIPAVERRQVDLKMSVRRRSGI